MRKSKFLSHKQSPQRRLWPAVWLAWPLLIFVCWQLDTKWGLACLLFSALAVTSWLVFRSLFSRTSLRVTVVVLPALIAILCIPARTMVQSQILHTQLREIGIQEYEIIANPNWNWATPLLDSRYFSTQLKRVRLDVAHINVPKLSSLDTEHLTYVVVQRDENSDLPIPRSLSDWIHSCPVLKEVDIRLSRLISSDLHWIEGLQLPTRLSADNWSAGIQGLQSPWLTHMVMGHANFDSRFSEVAFETPKLDYLSLRSCTLSFPEVLVQLTPGRRLEIIDCQLSPECLAACFDTPTRVLSLMDLNFPAQFRLNRSATENASSPLGRGIMFFGCNSLSSYLQNIVEHRQPRELSVRDSGTLSPEQVGSLISFPSIRHLILEGTWITEAHLTALGDLDRPLKLDLANSTLSMEAENRVRNSSPQLELVITNRVLNE